MARQSDYNHSHWCGECGQTHYDHTMRCADTPRLMCSACYEKRFRNTPVGLYGIKDVAK